jgi:hypothetical protein
VAIYSIAERNLNKPLFSVIWDWQCSHQLIFDTSIFSPISFLSVLWHNLRQSQVDMYVVSWLFDSFQLCQMHTVWCSYHAYKLTIQFRYTFSTILHGIVYLSTSDIYILVTRHSLIIPKSHYPSLDATPPSVSNFQ